MKIFFLTFLAAFAFAASYGQQVKSSEVPAETTKELKIIYPKVKHVQWTREEEGYRASFEQNKIKTSVLIDSYGNWLDTRTNVLQTALPDSVMMYLNKNFPSLKIENTMKVVPLSELVFWYVDADDKYYVFNETGGYVRTDEKEKQ
jgi:hypothetical protein